MRAVSGSQTLSVVVSVRAPRALGCSQRAGGFQKATVGFQEMTVGCQKMTVVPGCLERTLKVQTDPCGHLWMVRSRCVFRENRFQGKCRPGE